MARGGVGGLCLAGRRSVAEAVIGRAQVRPALDHKAGKLVATPRSAGRRGSRVLRTAARLWSWAAWVGAKASAVHSQTFPAISWRPYPLGGKWLTGEVPR